MNVSDLRLLASLPHGKINDHASVLWGFDEATLTGYVQRPKRTNECTPGDVLFTIEDH